MSESQAKYREAVGAALLGLSVNLVLGLIKLVAGLISRSAALVADAVNSLGDTLSSTATLAGLLIAQRPADSEHPYGHARAEGIAATNVAVLIILSAIVVGWEAVQRLGSSTAEAHWWTLLIAAGNIVLKESLFQYKIRIGRRTGSNAIMANAWDHRSDALCSMAVFVSLAIIRWGGPAWSWVDPTAAIIVSVGVIWSGIRLFQTSASELMDIQADDKFVSEIRHAARMIAGVEQIETLLVRKTGLEYLVDIHIEVRADLTVEQGHRISHILKDHLLTKFSQLRDVLVHIEPYPHKHDDIMVSQ